MSDSVRPRRQQPIRFLCPWNSPGKNTGVGCHFLLQCMKVKSESEVAQSCPTLHDPLDYSLPGSPVHGIFKARVLEWVAISFSRVSSLPRDQTQVSYIADRCFTLWAIREAKVLIWCIYCVYAVKLNSLLTLHIWYTERTSCSLAVLEHTWSA